MSQKKTAQNVTFYQEDKLGVFVDGPGSFEMMKQLGLRADYVELLNYFSRHSRLVRASYYTPRHEDENGFNKLQGLVDVLQYNGWHVFEKRAKEYEDSSGHVHEKCSIAVDLSLDMVTLAKNFDHIVLFSPDGAHARTVAKIQAMGVRVTVCGTLLGDVCMMSDALRRQADCFVELNDFDFGKAFNK